MKKFTYLALVLSFGLFTIGCEKPKDAPKAEPKMEGKMEETKPAETAAPAEGKMEEKEATPLETPADPTAPAETK